METPTQETQESAPTTEAVPSPELRWAFAAAEKRRTFTGLLARSWALWLLLALAGAAIAIPESGVRAALPAGLTSMNAMLLTGLGAILLSLGLFALSLRFTPIGKLSYRMHAGGIDVRRGFQKRSYTWHNFLVFYDRSARSRPNATPDELPPIVAHERALYGTTIYLQKQHVGFGKVFLLLYVRPEHTEAVLAFLRDHLDERPFRSEQDLGLSRYEFR